MTVLTPYAGPNGCANDYQSLNTFPHLPHETIYGIISDSIAGFAHPFLMTEDEDDVPQWDPINALSQVSYAFREMTFDVTSKVIGLNISRIDRTHSPSPLGKLREARAMMRWGRRGDDCGNHAGSYEIYQYSPLMRMYSSLYAAALLRGTFKGGGVNDLATTMPRYTRMALTGLYNASTVRRTEAVPVRLTTYVDQAVLEHTEFWVLTKFFYHLVSAIKFFMHWDHNDPETRLKTVHAWLEKVESWKEACHDSIWEITYARPPIPRMTAEVLQITGIFQVLQELLATDKPLCLDACGDDIGHFNITTRVGWLMAEWQPLLSYQGHAYLSAASLSGELSLKCAARKLESGALLF